MEPKNWEPEPFNRTLNVFLDQHKDRTSCYTQTTQEPSKSVAQTDIKHPPSLFAYQMWKHRMAIKIDHLHILPLCKLFCYIRSLHMMFYDMFSDQSTQFGISDDAGPENMSLSNKNHNNRSVTTFRHFNSLPVYCSSTILCKTPSHSIPPQMTWYWY